MSLDVPRAGRDGDEGIPGRGRAGAAPEGARGGMAPAPAASSMKIHRSDTPRPSPRDRFPALVVARPPARRALAGPGVAAAVARAEGLRAAEAQGRARAAGLAEDAARVRARLASLEGGVPAARQRPAAPPERGLREGLERALFAELAAPALPLAGTRGAASGAQASAVPCPGELVALVERVELLVRSGRPALRLGALGLDVEVRRTGPGAVALTLRGAAAGLHAARVRAALEARGLRVSALAVG